MNEFERTYMHSRYCKRCIRVGRIPPNERDSTHSYCKDCRREYARDRYHNGSQFRSPLEQVHLLILQTERMLELGRTEEGIATLTMCRHRLAGILRGMGIPVSSVDPEALSEPLGIMLAKLFQMQERSPQWEGYRKIVRAAHPEWNEPDWDEETP